ncbi:hypothetical protein TcasGA2_TC034719 [Tribolium castaneum]|uniref:Proline-rich transmembrane protein 3/4 domain-containing protein n=1 Tax=Tribolium castaneum TaxID=7070 RepID=A0A139WGL5_TRICA|nr:hypothetical protein TcasGA2_TC034719 [Tribolium castaneum]
MPAWGRFLRRVDCGFGCTDNRKFPCRPSSSSALSSAHHRREKNVTIAMLKPSDLSVATTSAQRRRRRIKKSICDSSPHQDCGLDETKENVFLTIRTCLLTRFASIFQKTLLIKQLLLYYLLLISWCSVSSSVEAYSSAFDKSEHLLEKMNLEQSIAAVFNKVAYGSTTKRSIPDNAYPVTTLATPLLTTYKYSDGNDEWERVDVKNERPSGRSSVDFETSDYEEKKDDGYGSDLEKDHVLPTSAPAADILKNNNNKHYNNPNRYNNDRLKPDFEPGEQVTESNIKSTTGASLHRNVRPTKSMYSKDIPSYIPPNRDFFTPPIPPAFQHPFADKPTLRGTNSHGFASRRPIPPPSLMPSKDRIPFRPDLPKVNAEKIPEPKTEKTEKKKTLNTPSQSAKLGDFYGLNRHNETSFEYEKSYAPEPSITRILSGSNGRHDDIQIPEILYRAVTATPQNVKTTKTRAPAAEPSVEIVRDEVEEHETERSEEITESVTVRKEETTQVSVNLPNVKEKETNVTKASTEEIWLICWNVHVYLVVFGYILLAIYSIYKLVRYENDPHMFSKSYFLTIHLMLTVICVLRIFYLTYDPYNVNKSFNIFLYEFLHSFPLSLLATTFAVLILFLLKRTLTHLEVKTRPVFLVVFALLHIVLCICLSTFESFGHFEKASLIVCRPVFVLLSWALGFSYLYLYRIIKNVLAKKSQNLSEMCTQNISYASHITIAVALLFILLGFVQLYALFFIKIDRFNDETKHHWILWGFELSVRFLEISIITLLAIVVSLKMSQREKQTGGFPLFPCTTSDSSTDNIYPNNCNTNPNALNYSRNEMIMDNIPTEPVERPNLLKTAFQNDSFDKKSTLERYHSDSERTSNFDRFERPNWSDRFDSRPNNHEANFGRSSARLNSAKYYTKPKYDDEGGAQERNIYSEPVDNHQYERTRHDFERGDFDRRSRNSSNTSGRRSTGRTRKNHARPHLGVQTLPNHQDSMLVDEQGFVRFRHMQEEKPSQGHFSDA